MNRTGWRRQIRCRTVQQRPGGRPQSRVSPSAASTLDIRRRCPGELKERASREAFYAERFQRAASDTPGLPSRSVPADRGEHAIGNSPRSLTDAVDFSALNARVYFDDFRAEDHRHTVASQATQHAVERRGQDD